MSTAWTTSTAVQFAEALVEASRDPLAALAHYHYQRDGRGLLAVSVRGPFGGTLSALRELQIGYRPLAQYRRLSAPHTAGSARVCADDIIRRIETYHPATQFVVAVVVGPTFLTVPFTLPLDAPVMLDEAAGVH